MKKFDGSIKGLFEDAERLTPPPGLWSAIEARSGLTARGPGFRDGSWIRLAASVVLAAGLLGLGVIVKGRISQGNATTASVVQSSIDTVAMARTAAPADTDTEIVDPELLGWHADLGEMDEVADEAGEIL